MIDFEDVELVAISGNGGSGCGPVGAIIFLVLIVVMFCVALSNSDECSKKHCTNGGTPRLQNHACQCVEEAK